MHYFFPKEIYKLSRNLLTTQITKLLVELFFSFLSPLTFNQQMNFPQLTKPCPLGFLKTLSQCWLFMNLFFFFLLVHKHLPIYSGHSRQISCRKALAVMSNVLNLSSVPNPTTSSCSTGVSVLSVRRHNFIKTYEKIH